MYIRPGEDTLRWEVGVKNKWCWDWIEEVGADGQPHGTWCHKLKEAGASSSGKQIFFIFDQDINK